MKDPIEITELNEWLTDLPTTLRYRDGEEIVDCCLTFYFHKDGSHKWTVAYYCREYDYFVVCGYGDTIVEAVTHLRKLYKDLRKQMVEGVVGQ